MRPRSPGRSEFSAAPGAVNRGLGVRRVRWSRVAAVVVAAGLWVGIIAAVLAVVR